MEESKSKRVRFFTILISLISVYACSEQKTVAESSQDQSENILQVIDDPSIMININKYLDWEVISNMIKLDNNKEKQAFDKVREGFSYGQIGLEFKKNDVLYRKTKSYTIKNSVHVVYEMFAGGEIQFVDFEVDTVSNRIVDLFAYQMGDSFLNLIKYQVKTEYGDFHSLFLLAKEAFEIGDIDRAWDHMLMIPDDLHNMYPYRILKMSIAEYDPQLYAELVDQLQLEKFDSRYLGYLNYKSALLNDDASLLLMNSSKLAGMVGESAILSAFEGYGLWLIGSSPEAFEKYEKTINLAPNHLLGYSSKIDLLLLQNDEKNAIQVIESMNKKFNLSKSDWEEILIDHREFIVNHPELF